MISFKLFAGTHVGLRENNEDNFTVCPDLTSGEWIVPADHQQAIQLGQYGAVVVVADGMGGQNAGEVASAIAIDTVQEMFVQKSISPDMLNKPELIKAFLQKIIQEADVRIKRHGVDNPSTKGMGSTIVMAWIICKKVYVAWLGDSRAYSYIPHKGIGRLSKDHSYVQQLVDAGTITEDEAMVHPNSNIITRSLGDTSQKAKPDVNEFELEKGQIILLCSDGLCGSCKDEVIGGILDDELNDLLKCKERLTNAALEAGGSDNITIALFQVVSIEDDDTSVVNKKQEVNNSVNSKKLFTKKGLFVIFVALIISTICCACYYFLCYTPSKISISQIELVLSSDSLIYGSSITYEVKVLPEESGKGYKLEFDHNILKVDTSTCKITMKKKVSTDMELKIISTVDTSKTSVKKLYLKKKKEVPLCKDSLPIIINKVSIPNGSIITDNKDDGISDAPEENINISKRDGQSKISQIIKQDSIQKISK